MSEEKVSSLKFLVGLQDATLAQKLFFTAVVVPELRNVFEHYVDDLIEMGKEGK